MGTSVYGVNTRKEGFCILQTIKGSFSPSYCRSRNVAFWHCPRWDVAFLFILYLDAFLSCLPSLCPLTLLFSLLFCCLPPPQFSCVLSIFFSYFVSLIFSLFLSLSCFSSFRIFLPLIPFTNFYLSFFFIFGFSFAFHSSITCSSSSSSISLFLYSFSSPPATSSMNADSSSSGSSP